MAGRRDDVLASTGAYTLEPTQLGSPRATSVHGRPPEWSLSGREGLACFRNDVPITPELIRQHGLTPDEYERFRGLIDRDPTLTELGIVSAMWNEHCSYKSSRKHLRGLPTSAPWVIQGPGENAGIIDIGDGLACVFKMESHNHPSFIEPYQGAATGVGGILRDVFTMGARPIAALNALRFGLAGPSPHTPPRLRRGGGHRRLRQFLRRSHRRRRRRLSPALRWQHPRQRHGGGPRPHRRDLLRGGHGRRESDRLSRLEDRPRRHSRRQHGLGRIRRRL